MTQNQTDDKQSQVLLFENTLQDFISTDSQSRIRLSDRHTKFGKTSLEWQIGVGGILCFNTPIGYRAFAGSLSDQRRESLVVLLYNETPSSDTLLFECGIDGVKSTWFELGLDFKGWRMEWVMYDRDMQGTPSEKMNTLTIQAPKSMEGKSLYFSTLILSTPLDARHHTRSMQVPFVNLEADTKANSHWMSLYAFAKAYEKFRPQGDRPQEYLEDVQLIHQRYYAYLYNLRSAKAFNEIEKSYQQYQICIEGDSIKGRSIDYHNADVIWDHVDKKAYLKKINGVDASRCIEDMYNMAVFYHQTTDEHQKKQVKQMFIHMFWHFYDQGFAEGSSVGTVHHLGYEIRAYFQVLYLMKDVLKQAGWLEKAKQSMNWFSGVGRIFYEDLEANGVDMDVLNTFLESMLASILMESDHQRQAKLLQQFSKWLDFSCSPKEGLMGPFKESGLGFHHAGLYPAYTRDGLIGLTPVVYLLRNTKYRLSEKQHELVKKAVMHFRLFSNREQFLISVSGRHPKGTEKLDTAPFKYMALAGSPDGKEEIDTEVAAAYIRLVAHQKDELVTQFESLGITKEAAPQGNWARNTAALSLHRRGEWLVGVRGHSKYVWSHETYQSANLYGRYISYGHIQIMSQGTPVNNQASGYSQKGWDWNSWPGTTTIHLPVDQLKSDVRNVDTFSGFEEMLLSDEAYAGALDLQGINGMFAMKLHEHPKYHGSHKARKSVFMFDNRVIALGSDIENTHQVYPTRTTLFQNHVADNNKPMFINSTNGITEMNCQHQIKTQQVSYLLDNTGNGYVLPKGYQITVTRASQESRDQQNASKTQGNFDKAVIEHGVAPSGAGYEYMIVVDTTLEALEEIKHQMNEGREGIYTVLQKDTYAHIVKDHDTHTIGYALFEANIEINKGYVGKIDTPAMVMTKEEGEELVLSVCDPDLRLYEGVDTSQYDENGNQIEVSMYSRAWRKNTSQMHTLQLEVIGEWVLADKNEKYKVIVKEGNTTTFAIHCKGGDPVELRLVKNKEFK